MKNQEKSSDSSWKKPGTITKLFTLIFKILASFFVVSLIGAGIAFLLSFVLGYDYPKLYFLQNPDEYFLLTGLITILIYLRTKKR